VLQVFDGVMKGVSEQSALRQKIVHYALGVSRERNHNLEFGKPVSAWLAFKHKWADKIVLSKIRARLGGRLK
jgi:long-chain acyl-CoA synthetase